MWRTARGQSGVGGALIAIVVAFLSLLIVSPSSATAARVAHSPRRSATPKTAGPPVRHPLTASALNSDHGILTRLQAGQRNLEKETADLDAAFRQQIAQLGSGIENSKRETQQMLEETGKRIDSTQRLLKAIVALLVLLCGGLFYVGRRLPRLQDNASAQKGDVMEPKLDDEGLVSWRKG
jgi:flagellin-like protein